MDPSWFAPEKPISNPLTQETKEVVLAQQYTAPSGAVVPIDCVDCYQRSVVFSPSHEFAVTGTEGTAPVEVTDETTTAAGRRLRQMYPDEPIALLNFASARNPGGGFISFARAQEESICRASALFPTIAKHHDYYAYNRSHKSLYYSDYMIYSPNVPFFRDDDAKFTEEPYYADVITSPAVNRGAMKSNYDKATGNEVMTVRIRKILQVAVEFNAKVIVLGAFGCGAFRNSPTDVAAIFKHLLIDEGFQGHFKHITFAIPKGKGGVNHNTFADVFQV